MKKMLIAVIVLVVLAAGSITAFMIIKNKEDKKNAESAALAADYILFSFDSDSITSASFECEDGTYSAVLEDSEWELADSDEFVIRNTYVQGICSYMCDLTAEKDYGEATDESKTLYGLDEPTVITLSDGTNDYTIYVGDADPTDSYYYVMVEGKSKIYAIDATDGSDLKTTRLMLKDRYLVPYAADEMSSVQLIKNGETIYNLTYDSENSSWSLPDEYSLLTTDQSAITAMIAVMIRCEAQEMFDEDLQDYSKYGFDEPTAELVVTGLDGTETKLLFSYYGTNTDTYTYVLFESTGQVAAFYTGDIDFIEDTPKDYISEQVCNISIYDITGFDFSYNGSSDTFTVDMDNSDVSMNGTSITDTDVQSDFTNFYNSIIYLELTDVDVSAEPDMSQLLMTAVFKLEEGGETTLQLYKADEDNLYVFIDGSFTGAICDMSDLTSKDSISEFYEILCDGVSES